MKTKIALVPCSALACAFFSLMACSDDGNPNEASDASASSSSGGSSSGGASCTYDANTFESGCYEIITTVSGDSDNPYCEDEGGTFHVDIENLHDYLFAEFGDEDCSAGEKTQCTERYTCTFENSTEQHEIILEGPNRAKGVRVVSAEGHGACTETQQLAKTDEGRCGN